MARAITLSCGRLPCRRTRQQVTGAQPGRADEDAVHPVFQLDLPALDIAGKTEGAVGPPDQLAGQIGTIDHPVLDGFQLAAGQAAQQRGCGGASCVRRCC